MIRQYKVSDRKSSPPLSPTPSTLRAVHKTMSSSPPMLPPTTSKTEWRIHLAKTLDSSLGPPGNLVSVSAGEEGGGNLLSLPLALSSLHPAISRTLEL